MKTLPETVHFYITMFFNKHLQHILFGLLLLSTQNIQSNGNQVVSVQDAAGSQNLYALKEYQDLADEETECTYDANGNLTRDLDRGITNIRYNRLNLPEWVTFTNGDRISMDYDATGRLLEMSCANLSTKLMPLIVDGERVQANIPVTEGYGTLYGDGIDYEYEYVYDETTGHSRPTITNVRVHHPEGYADVSERYYAEDHFYYYRYDYLGNVCEVWSPGWEMAPGSFAPPHVAQQTRYYPPQRTAQGALTGRRAATLQVRRQGIRGRTRLGHVRQRGEVVLSRHHAHHLARPAGREVL